MVRIVTKDRAPLLSELARVKTRQALGQGDDAVPAGTTGTVVFVYDNGRAFEVEFAGPPSNIVLTVQRADLDYA